MRNKPSPVASIDVAYLIKWEPMWITSEGALVMEMASSQVPIMVFAGY